MNPHEVAANLDDKSIKILRLLLREGRFLNEGVPVTLSTPTVKSEHGWTNQTILRRFRKLRDAGLVRLHEVKPGNPEYERYPRQPKQIKLDASASDIQEVINHWNGREVRSPAKLTDDLDDIDHRIDATDDRLTNRIDTVESTLESHLDDHAATDCRRAQYLRRTLSATLGSLISVIVILTIIAFRTPAIFRTVLLAALVAVFVVAVVSGTIIYVVSKHTYFQTEDNSASQSSTD